jgi:segregation and condensation protein B
VTRPTEPDEPQTGDPETTTEAPAEAPVAAATEAPVTEEPVTEEPRTEEPENEPNAPESSTRESPATDPPEEASEPSLEGEPGEPTPARDSDSVIDLEATVNLTGDPEMFAAAMRDDRSVAEAKAGAVSRAHLKGLLEALIFAGDKPLKTGDLAKAASANAKLVKELLAELKGDYTPRGIQLDEVAGGWIFRTSAAYAPFVRDLTKQKPVRLTRAQVETLAIIAYRQPVTRPEVDDIRGVDSGPVLKLLLERDLVRILGKKDEPGRPLIYGTTVVFLEFFGLRSLKDLPTLAEFTELNEDSRRVVERELGEVLDSSQPAPAVAEPAGEAPPEGAAPAEGAGEEPPHEETPAEEAEAPAEETPAEEATGDEEPEADDGLAHDTIAPPPGESSPEEMEPEAT